MAEEMHWGLSPYESFMVSEKSSRRPSGSAVAGLVLGSVGTALAAGAWIFGPIVANNRTKGVEMLANAQYNATNNQLNLLSNLLAAERNERVAQGTTISQTITDTISGQQTSQLTAQQAAELSSMQSYAPYWSVPTMEEVYSNIRGELRPYNMWDFAVALNMVASDNWMLLEKWFPGMDENDRNEKLVQMTVNWLKDEDARYKDSKIWHYLNG